MLKTGQNIFQLLSILITEVEKGVRKICRKFTGEHPCRSAISIKLQSNVVKIALRHACYPVSLLHIFKTPFLENTSGGLLLS